MWSTLQKDTQNKPPYFTDFSISSLFFPTFHPLPLKMKFALATILFASRWIVAIAVDSSLRGATIHRNQYPALASASSSGQNQDCKAKCEDKDTWQKCMAYFMDSGFYDPEDWCKSYVKACIQNCPAVHDAAIPESVFSMSKTNEESSADNELSFI